MNISSLFLNTLRRRGNGQFCIGLMRNATIISIFFTFFNTAAKTCFAGFSFAPT